MRSGWTTGAIACSAPATLSASSPSARRKFTTLTSGRAPRTSRTGCVLSGPSTINIERRLQMEPSSSRASFRSERLRHPARWLGRVAAVATCAMMLGGALGAATPLPAAALFGSLTTLYLNNISVPLQGGLDAVENYQAP